MQQTRREFLTTAAVTAGATALGLLPGVQATGAVQQPKSLAGVVGFTLGGLVAQQERGELNIFNIPKLFRDELGMQLIDCNTGFLESADAAYIQKVRENAEQHDCYFTMLKVKNRIGDLDGKNAAEREKALATAKGWIEAAHGLGARWLRLVMPEFKAGDPPSKLATYRDLAVFAEDRQVQLVVENNGWMKSDPDALPRVVAAVGKNIAPGPDTGNWDDDTRYAGLEKAFQGAVTCDFKVFDLDAQHHHAPYDIRKCFNIGWKAGFRGPWAIEHWNEDTKAFVRDTVWIRDQLKGWMAEAGQ